MGGLIIGLFVEKECGILKKILHSLKSMLRTYSTDFSTKWTECTLMYIASCADAGLKICQLTYSLFAIHIQNIKAIPLNKSVFLR